jgi:hypothetical protein
MYQEISNVPRNRHFSIFGLVKVIPHDHRPSAIRSSDGHPTRRCRTQIKQIELDSTLQPSSKSRRQTQREAKRETNGLGIVLIARKGGHIVQVALINAVEGKPIGPIMRRKKIRDRYYDEIARLEGLLEAFITRTEGDSIKVDATFWATKFIKTYKDSHKDFDAMINLMNEMGELYGFYFTTSKSLEEIRKQLSDLEKRLGRGKIKHIYTDNPRQDEKIFKDIFEREGEGEEEECKITMSKDLFHVMQELYAPCKKSDLRASFMGYVSRAFTTVEKDDVDLIVKGILLSMPQPLNRDAEEKVREEVEANRSKYSCRLRKYVREKASICQALDAAFLQFTRKGVFDDAKMFKTIDNIKKLVNAGYLDDKADTLFYNIGTDERPKYITVRGTGHLESFHRCLRKIFTGTHDPIKAHLLTLNFAARWNLKKHWLIRKQDIPCGVYDIELLNSVHRLQHQLELDSPFYTGWDPVKVKQERQEQHGQRREHIPAIGIFGEHTANNAASAWNEYKKNSETSPDEDLAENLENVEALWPAADRTLAAKAQNLPCHVGPVRTYDEIQLLKALMRRPDFLKKKALKTVARDQHQQFEMTMWRYINRSASELHNAYHWDRMATYYNTIIYETIGNGETLIPVCPRYLSSEVRELKVKEMTLKEPKHLKDAAKILAVKVSVKVAQGSTPSQQEHHDRYVQAQAKAVHHHRAAGIVPKLKTRKAPVERQAAPATVPNMNASGIQDISSSKKRKICPDSACAITMAGSRKHNPRCRFERWRTVPVNKKNRRKGKETPTEAQLRAFQARNAHPTQHHGGTARVRGGGGGCQGRGRGRGRGGGRDAAQGGRGRGRGRDRGRGRRRRRGM